MILKLSKFLYILFIFYIGWFQDVFFIIPRMPLILGASMIVVLLLHKSSKDNMRVIITKPLFLWIIFAFYILFAGFLVASDKTHLINSWLTYVQTLALIFYIVNVSKLEKSNDFFIKSYFVFSIIYMITMLFWGYDGSGGRLYLTQSSNPNGDGLTLLSGVFCTLILLDRTKLVKTLLSFSIVGLFVYTIILTGSRKSFLVVLVLIILWFIIVFKDHWKYITLNKKIIITVTLIVGYFVIAHNVLPMFFESSLYWRMANKGITIGSDQIRSGMYKEAIDLFTNNPIFGVGFNHYRILSIYRTYSHSTYAEIISTTGIVGTIIYFSSYIVIIKNLFSIYFNKKDSFVSNRAMQYIILFLSMLVLGTGVIHFYGIRDNILFALMISFYYVEELKYKEILSCSDNVREKNYVKDWDIS